MDTQGFVVGPLSVLCIVALVMGTASAAVITATDSTINPSTGTVHHHLSPEAIISSLEQKGVDVSGVKTALQNGDITSVHTWLKSYFDAHKGEMPLSHHHRHPQPVSPTGTSQ